MLKGLELILLVGVILGIVGGIDAGNSYSSTGHYTPSSLNKVGTALLAVTFGFTVVAVVMTSFSTPHAEAGEHRLFFAIVASLPLMLARLVYSCFSTFTHNKNFNLLTGSTTLLLCLALLEEFIVVVIY